MRTPETQRGPTTPCGHVVHFYENDDELHRAVADHLAESLRRGEPGLVLATSPHCEGIRRRLAETGIDVDEASSVELLGFFDAREVLDSLIDDGQLSWPRFTERVGGLLERALDGRDAAKVCAFGEMVQLLFEDGDGSGALALEEMWNRLAATHPFSLLCGYSMSTFQGGGPSEQFAAICSAHEHVQHPPRLLEREVVRRMESERALLRTQRELADILDNAVDAIHCVGADGTILWANAAELELLGYTAEEYIGRSIIDFHADEEVITEILERLASGGELRDHRARLVAKDGSIKHVAISSNVRFERGEFLYTRCFTRDITERKKAEEAIEAANRAKDEFLAMLGHELRNPLAPIVTALQLMRLRLGEAGAREREVIERQVQHLVRLIDDLLDVSRITRGKVELRKEVLELSEAVARGIELASPLIERRRHTLEVAVPDSGLRVQGDVHRLAQVVSNLLNNAAKFTEPGGRIAVEARRDDARDEVVLTVRDNGIGIDGELLPRLFELFVQNEQSLERSQGGLGLGLAIVRSLVTLHGGTVSVHSEGRGHGAELEVRLPAARSFEASDAPTDLAGIPAPRPGARRILVVDDNLDAAEVLAEMLRALGHHAQPTFDGPSALARAVELRPEIVFVDIGLPVMDGYEVARRLRATAGLEQVTLVAVTGYGRTSDRERSRAAGFDAHLVKPLILDELESIIEGAHAG